MNNDINTEHALFINWIPPFVELLKYHRCVIRSV